MKTKYTLLNISILYYILTILLLFLVYTTSTGNSFFYYILLSIFQILCLIGITMLAIFNQKKWLSSISGVLNMYLLLSYLIVPLIVQILIQN
jgi:hypothetical protein